MPTYSQLQDAQLRGQIGQRINSGRLPLTIAHTIAGGYGTGTKCPACDLPITPEQIEYDVEDEDVGPLSMHLGCHVIWQTECQARLQARAGADT